MYVYRCVGFPCFTYSLDSYSTVRTRFTIFQLKKNCAISSQRMSPLILVSSIHIPQYSKLDSASAFNDEAPIHLVKGNR